MYFTEIVYAEEGEAKMRRRRQRRSFSSKVMRRRRENIISFYHEKEMGRLREKIRLLERIKKLKG